MIPKSSPWTLGHPQILAQPPDWIATPHAICDVSSLLNEMLYSNKRYVHTPVVVSVVDQEFASTYTSAGRIIVVFLVLPR